MVTKCEELQHERRKKKGFEVNLALGHDNVHIFLDSTLVLLLSLLCFHTHSAAIAVTFQCPVFVFASTATQ